MEQAWDLTSAYREGLGGGSLSARVEIADQPTVLDLLRGS